MILVATPRTAHSQGSLPDQAQRVFDLVNRARGDYGLPALALNPLLVTAAQSHVNDMIANQNYSHTGSDGSSVRARARRVGYASGLGVSENWVATSGPDGALAWWMNSYVHRGNILNPKWREAGVGVVRDPNNGMQIFVLVFGGGQDGAPSPEPVPVAKRDILPVPAAGMRYTVQPGDTLSGIASRYGLGWQTVASANGLNEFSVLQIGQEILLPGVRATSSVSPTGPAAMGTGGPTDLPGPHHLVQSGDTLISIALRYGVTWQEVAAANGLHEQSTLHIGQLLHIPGQPEIVPSVTDAKVEEAAIEPSARPVEYAEHTVASGETVVSIARAHDIGWAELLRINGLAADTILQIGQVIRLPAR